MTSFLQFFCRFHLLQQTSPRTSSEGNYTSINLTLEFLILSARLSWGWRQMPHKATPIPAELEGAFCSTTEYDTPLFLPTQASLTWPYSFKEIIHCLTQRILSRLISLHWSFSLIPEPLWLQQWALLNADMKIFFVMQCKTFAESRHLQTRPITEYLNTLHTALEPEILFIWPLKRDDTHLSSDEGVIFDHIQQLFNVMSSKSFKIFP